MIPNKLATNPAKINIKNISNYLSAKVRAFKLYIYDRFISNKLSSCDDADTFLHEKEQIKYRELTAEKLNSCKSKGYCTFCGCETVGPGNKFLGWAACEKEGCYPEMMTKTEWEDYKIKNNIKL